MTVETRICTLPERRGWVAPPSILYFTALIWLGFVVLHPLLRLAFDLVLAPADSLTLVTSQSFKLAYWTRQPPFYTWNLWLWSTLLGPGPLAVQVTKYSMMTVAGIGYVMAGLHATRDPLRAAVGSLVVMLIFNVGFTVHDQSTHSVGLIAGIALLLWGYARVTDRADLAGYGLIAIGSAVCVLSKHSGWVVVIALPIACLFVAPMRHLILSWRLSTALGLAFLAALPVIALLVQNWTDASSHLSATLTLKGSDATVLDRLRGQFMLFGGYIVLTLPLALIVALAMPVARGRAVRGLKGAATDLLRPANAPPLVVAVGIAIVLILAALAVGVLFSGAARVPSRHVLVAVVLSALYIVWTLPAARATARNGLALATLVAALQAGLLVTRAVGYALPGKPFCDNCRQMTPVADLASRLRDRGLAQATIVADDKMTAGNLRQYLPQARIILTQLPKSAAPPPPVGVLRSPCVYLSRRPRVATPPARGHDRAGLDRALGGSMVDRIDVPWRIDIDGERRLTPWWLAPLPADMDSCR